MSELVSYLLDDGVATIILNNGKANVISLAVLERFNAALDQATEDRAVVIITGQPGILSGGYDLKVMKSSRENSANLVATGSAFARRMLSHPYPIIVACSGHAVAKGAFILLSADYRIGVEGPFRIGFNEVAIGMTMHDVGLTLSRYRLHRSMFDRSVITAEMFDPAGALNAGFFDELTSPDALTATARSTADRLKKLDMTAYLNTKLKARKALLEELDSGIQSDRKHSACPLPSREE